MKINNVKSSIQQIVENSMKLNRVPGAAVVSVDANGCIEIGCLGYADVRKNIHLQSNSLFQVASMSKPVTSWGIMKLVQDGYLNVDKDISTYLKRGDQLSKTLSLTGITARNLLNHTAGLSNVYYYGARAGSLVPDVLDSLSGKKYSNDRVRSISKPGTVFNYTGGGYTLLQLLIEDITGMDFADYMYNEILKPLHMVSSSFNWNDIHPENRVVSYNIYGKNHADRFYAEKAAAGLYSSIEDQLQFLLENLSIYHSKILPKRLLQPELIKSMHKWTDRFIPYGLGFSVCNLSSNDVAIFHTGVNIGWNSILLMLPNKQSGIVVLTNSDNGCNVIYDTLNFWLESHEIQMSKSDVQKLGLAPRGKFKSMLYHHAIRCLDFTRRFKYFRGKMK